MHQNLRTECPRCSRPLQHFNGHIGYCSQHKWVSPSGLGFDAEAAEQNRQDAAAEEKQRLEAERKKAEAQAQAVRERHRSSVRKAAMIIIALCAIVAAVVYFVVRPSMQYNHATNSFMVGEYTSAREQFSALGNYRDSMARVLLCDAMLDLQEGQPEDAAATLEQLTNDGQSDIARQLAEALRPLIADWQEKGLTPDVLLLLLSKVEMIDPDGTLDIAALKTEGHIALLDGTQLSTRVNDVNADGTAELVVLNPDYTVSIYQMTDDANVSLAVENRISAACAMEFGGAYKEADVSAYVACVEEAYRLLPDSTTQAALAAAYHTRAVVQENAGDIDGALLDAKRALETSGQTEDFNYYYDLNLRKCKTGNDIATAIALWDEFAADTASELTRHAANTRWQLDAAQMHMTHATELAAKKDERCMAALQIAAELGADVSNAIVEVESHFKPGLFLAELRLMEIEHADDEAKKQQIHADMADEIRIAISEWKARSIQPTDVLALIVFADAHSIDISSIHRETIYEEAALAAVGTVSQHSFVNWNGDAYKELLVLDSEGTLSLYDFDETWHVVSSLNTRLPGSSYTITDEVAPLMLVLSAQQDEFLAVTGAGNALTPVFRESGISRYACDGTAVTFSKLLEGSIARYNEYAYEAVGTANRPVHTGVDWQQNDYPQPMHAAAAVRQYFEARAYAIAEEAALLTREATSPSHFSLEALGALPQPDVPGAVSAFAYQAEENRELFEVTYPSGPQTVRTWVAVENIDGWKVVGAADTYGVGMDVTAADYSVPLLCLNAEASGILTAKGSLATYRVLVPTAGRLGLVWQSGSKAVSRTSHVVSMYQGTLTGDVVFHYELQSSPNKQQSKDVFVSAGVYYVTVEASRADTEAYHLTITFEAEANVELESNDTPAQATPISLGTGYSASLTDAADVDYFSFNLDETSAVNVTLRTDGNSSKTTVYHYAVYSAADGSRFSTVSVPGNVQLAETGNLYLSPGAYLVQVAKGSAYTNNAYIVTVNVSQNGVMESEANDTLETANAVPVNEDIHASIGQEGDIDCFTFTLDGDAVIQPRFTFKPTDSSSKTYVLTLTDSTRHELLKVNIGGKESTKVIAPLALTAGTYTVKVENPQFVRQDYTLHLVSMAVDAAEKEPNDSAGLATELSVGAARTGVLTTEEDVDYYRVTFAQQTTVTLKFDFAQRTFQNTAFVLTVEQNGKTQWTANIKGDSGGIEQQLQFPAGEYYIRIKPSTWTSAVYTISLN